MSNTIDDRSRLREPLRDAARPAVADAVPQGVGDVSAPGSASTGLRGAREPSLDSVSRDGSATVAEGPALAQGEALTPEVVAELQAMLRAFGPATGAAAGRADIDLPFDENATGASLLSQGLGIAVGEMARAFGQGDDARRDPAIRLFESVHIGLRGIQAAETERLDRDDRKVTQGLGAAKSAVLEVLDGDVGGADGDRFRRELEGVCERWGMHLETDVNAVVQWVMRQSYLDTAEDMRFYAEKVKFYNEVKKMIRDEATRMRNIRAGYAGQEDTAELNPPVATRDDIPMEYDPITARSMGVGIGGTDPAQEARIQEIMDERANREAEQAAVQAEIDAWNADPANQRTESRRLDTTSIEHKDETLDGSQKTLRQFQEMIDEYGRDFLADFLSLPEDEQRALMEHWKENGFQISWGGAFKDPGDGWSDARIYDTTSTYYGPDTDDPEEFINAIFEQLSDDMDNDYNGTPKGLMANDGNATDLYALRIYPDLPDSVNVSVTADLPPELQARADACGLGSSSGGVDSGGFTPGQPAETVAELDAYIQKLEEDLNSVGEDAQLANVDVQNVLQRMQQYIQMMSNVSKMGHDTALSVIRKIGG